MIIVRARGARPSEGEREERVRRKRASRDDDVGAADERKSLGDVTFAQQMPTKEERLALPVPPRKKAKCAAPSLRRPSRMRLLPRLDPA